MQTVHFIAILLHILAAAIWIGGMIFLGVILIPVLRDRALGAQAVQLIHRTGIRFRNVGWACLLLLLATGVVNLTRWGVDWPRFTSGELWSSPWGRILAAKLALVAVALTLSGIHDFVVGPRATSAMRRAPGSDAARRLRRAAGWMGRSNLVVGIVLVALGIMLVRGLPS